MLEELTITETIAQPLDQLDEETIAALNKSPHHIDWLTGCKAQIMRYIAQHQWSAALVLLTKTPFSTDEIDELLAYLAAQKATRSLRTTINRWLRNEYTDMYNVPWCGPRRHQMNPELLVTVLGVL